VLAGTVLGMKQRDLFLMSDAALRDVIDMLDLDQLSTPVPAEWSRVQSPTLRDVLAAHTRDEAWVPDVLAGKSLDEVGEKWNGDLLGSDPIESYDRYNDIATEHVTRDDLDPRQTVHFLYGDYPLADGLVHLSIYRCFQAWSIGHLVGLDYELPDALVDLMWEELAPMLDELRSYGVFPPEVPVAPDADPQTRLLGKTGYLVP
jgi:hypothetical protein